MLSSCFGRRSSSGEDREPLLSRYQDDTSLQRKLHQKLHTYQMIRALSKGYMPSNEQVTVNLRSLLAEELLSPDNEDLSGSGQVLVDYVRQWLKQFIEMLQHKNSEDQIQDFVWNLCNRLSVDTEGIVQQTAKARARADVATSKSPASTHSYLSRTNPCFSLPKPANGRLLAADQRRLPPLFV